MIFYKLKYISKIFHENFPKSFQYIYLFILLLSLLNFLGFLSILPLVTILIFPEKLFELPLLSIINIYLMKKTIMSLKSIFLLFFSISNF